MNGLKSKIIQFIVDAERFIQYGDLPTWYYVKKGLKVGKRFDRQSGTRLDISNCWLIEIGDNVVLANRVQILAHDDSAEQLCGYRKVARVTIGNDVFVGAGTLIMPGVTIGDGSIIGSGAVVTKDIPPNSVAYGVPARVASTTAEYKEKIENDIKKAQQEGRVLDIEYDIHCKPNQKVERLEVKKGLKYYFKISRFCDVEEE